MKRTSMVTWCTYIYIYIYSGLKEIYHVADLELYLLSSCLIIAEIIKNIYIYCQ
jgi:hypothetical protein